MSNRDSDSVWSEELVAHDPYQGSFGPHANDDWFRHQNTEVMTRTACEVCGGSLPWSDDYNWKYMAAGGCLAGPFCSPECHWRFLE